MDKENTNNENIKHDDELNIDVGSWIYQRANAPIARHHWYVCPRCDKMVEQRENFCPRCGLVTNIDAYKKYILGE